VFKRKNLSAFHLKDFSFNARFLANYVQSFHRTHYVCDFCFFSSRKRRINKLPFSLSLSFLKLHYACVHQGKEEKYIAFFMYSDGTTFVLELLDIYSNDNKRSVIPDRESNNQSC